MPHKDPKVRKRYFRIYDEKPIEKKSQGRKI